MALISENCYEWVVAFFAVVCCGGTAVPIDVEQTAEEIQKAVRHADCGAMIISETYELILNAQKIPERRFVIRRDGGTDSFDALLSLGRTGEYSQETERLAGAVQGSDQALIVYTSGTTNTAKPVVLTHGNLMYNAWGGTGHGRRGHQSIYPTAILSYICPYLWDAWLSGSRNPLFFQWFFENNDERYQKI